MPVLANVLSIIVVDGSPCIRQRRWDKDALCSRVRGVKVHKVQGTTNVRISKSYRAIYRMVRIGSGHGLRATEFATYLSPPRPVSYIVRGGSPRSHRNLRVLDASPA